MNGKPVLTEIRDGIAEVTLNRPDNRNSMNKEMMNAFQEAIQKLKALHDLRCLIVTGSGKSFCAGADFKSETVSKHDRLPHEAGK